MHLHDAESIAELEQELFEENWMSAGTIQRELRYGPCFVVQEIGNGIVAFALTHHREGILDLLRLGVRKDWQGKGLGEMLLRRVLIVPCIGCVLMVTKSNAGAIALYRKLNFELWGSTENSYVLFRTSRQPILVCKPCSERLSSRPPDGTQALQTYNARSVFCSCFEHHPE